MLLNGQKHLRPVAEDLTRNKQKELNEFIKNGEGTDILILSIVSQLSKCLKFMNFREGCFVIRNSVQYLSELLRPAININFTKDESMRR